MTQTWTRNDQGDVVCGHGVPIGVHCCNCHSGFLLTGQECVCIVTPLKREFKVLVQNAIDGNMGPVREHFMSCDGFEAAQDMARLVDVLANAYVPMLWNLLQSIHHWQR